MCTYPSTPIFLTLTTIIISLSLTSANIGTLNAQNIKHDTAIQGTGENKQIEDLFKTLLISTPTAEGSNNEQKDVKCEDKNDMVCFNDDINKKMDDKKVEPPPDILLPFP